MVANTLDLLLCGTAIKTESNSSKKKSQNQVTNGSRPQSDSLSLDHQQSSQRDNRRLAAYLDPEGGRQVDGAQERIGSGRPGGCQVDGVQERIGSGRAGGTRSARQLSSARQLAPTRQLSFHPNAQPKSSESSGQTVVSSPRNDTSGTSESTTGEGVSADAPQPDTQTSQTRSSGGGAPVSTSESEAAPPPKPCKPPRKNSTTRRTSKSAQEKSKIPATNQSSGPRAHRSSQSPPRSRSSASTAQHSAASTASTTTSSSSSRTASNPEDGSKSLSKSESKDNKVGKESKNGKDGKDSNVGFSPTSQKRLPSSWSTPQVEGIASGITGGKVHTGLRFLQQKCKEDSNVGRQLEESPSSAPPTSATASATNIKRALPKDTSVSSATQNPGDHEDSGSLLTRSHTVPAGLLGSKLREDQEEVSSCSSQSVGEGGTGGRASGGGQEEHSGRETDAARVMGKLVESIGTKLRVSMSNNKSGGVKPMRGGRPDERSTRPLTKEEVKAALLRTQETSEAERERALKRIEDFKRSQTRAKDMALKQQDELRMKRAAERQAQFDELERRRVEVYALNKLMCESEEASVDLYKAKLAEQMGNAESTLSITSRETGGSCNDESRNPGDTENTEQHVSTMIHAV